MPFVRTPDEARQVIDLLFAGHVERGTTLILVTHDAALAQRCDRKMQLSDQGLQRDAG